MQLETNNSLKEIIFTIRNNKWWIIGTVGISVLLMTLYLVFVAVPIYQSHTQILVNKAEANGEAVQVQNVQENLDLINTYNVIIKSPRILDNVKSKLSKEYSESDLTQAIEVSNAANSQVIEITVESSDPKEAIAIANTTAQVFKQEIINIMKIDNITILSSAKNSEVLKPIKPRKVIMLTLSLIIGILLGGVIIFTRELFDRTLKNKEEVEAMFNLQVLGSIYDSDNNEKSSRRVKR
ncbi:YveK family protein [Carnobacterium maltaromaticum]|uniref:YveK family protein n=1 Tax=Carnobacterium maltaromaticum TaxID=2751 RepID=UPI00295E8303|nr:Wzz/FepE/Etk N-terminal domain-containing protein [Carnobacterium maltaromaticum]